MTAPNSPSPAPHAVQPGCGGDVAAEAGNGPAAGPRAARTYNTKVYGEGPGVGRGSHGSGTVTAGRGPKPGAWASGSSSPSGARTMKRYCSGAAEACQWAAVVASRTAPGPAGETTRGGAAEALGRWTGGWSTATVRLAVCRAGGVTSVRVAVTRTTYPGARSSGTGSTAWEPCDCRRGRGCGGPSVGRASHRTCHGRGSGSVTEQAGAVASGAPKEAWSRRGRSEGWGCGTAAMCRERGARTSPVRAGRAVEAVGVAGGLCVSVRVGAEVAGGVREAAGVWDADGDGVSVGVCGAVALPDPVPQGVLVMEGSCDGLAVSDPTAVSEGVRVKAEAGDGAALPDSVGVDVGARVENVDVIDGV